MHGNGVFKWSDGKIYDGQFVDDKRDGFGTMTYPDGKIYRGEWRFG